MPNCTKISTALGLSTKMLINNANTVRFGTTFAFPKWGRKNCKSVTSATASKVDLGNPDEATLPLSTYVGVGICLAMNKTTMDPKDVYVHTSILARNAHKGGMELHNPLHRGSTREGCANIFLRFFADLMKQALEEGKVEEVPWPQPPSPAISGREEDSETEWEDVEEVDKSGEQKEQPAADAAGDQCAAPTPASAQALAPATGVSPSLPSTSAQQGANRNPAPGNTTSSTSDHHRSHACIPANTARC